LKAAAKPEPLTTDVKENGFVRVPRSVCDHKSRTFKVETDDEMLSWSKHVTSHVTLAGAPPLLTKPSTCAPPESVRPHTLVHVSAGFAEALRQTGG
jgi:hypothetical protein